jgi:hypothetical protein
MKESEAIKFDPRILSAEVVIASAPIVPGVVVKS